MAELQGDRSAGRVAGGFGGAEWKGERCEGSVALVQGREGTGAHTLPFMSCVTLGTLLKLSEL